MTGETMTAPLLEAGGDLTGAPAKDSERLVKDDNERLGLPVQSVQTTTITSKSAAETRYVTTVEIRQAVQGRELTVLAAVGISWSGTLGHIDCPYSDHGGKTDWRWDDRKSGPSAPASASAPARARRIRSSTW